MPIYVFPSLRNLILSCSLFIVTPLNRIFLSLASSHLIGYTLQPHLCARFVCAVRAVRSLCPHPAPRRAFSALPRHFTVTSAFHPCYNVISERAYETLALRPFVVDAAIIGGFFTSLSQSSAAALAVRTPQNLACAENLRALPDGTLPSGCVHTDQPDRKLSPLSQMQSIKKEGLSALFSHGRAAVESARQR